jgi:hypothetical protein
MLDQQQHVLRDLAADAGAGDGPLVLERYAVGHEAEAFD